MVVSSRWCSSIKLGAHLDPQLGVEVRERLVHEEDLRLADDRPSERDALALTARELLRLALQQASQAESLSGFLDAAVDLGLGPLAQLQTEGHVVVDRHVRIERVALEDHGDVAVFRRDVVDAAIADVQARHR